MHEATANSTDFPHAWSVEILKTPPLIAPARQFTYPKQIVGEEDALARGALQLMVKPVTGPPFLATCALGFTDAAMPTGVFACPNLQEMCAVAGGYAYVIDTAKPEHCTHISLKPVVEVQPLVTDELLLFIGFHSIVAWRRNGIAWESGRLSWEGIRTTGIEDDSLHGFGWNLLTDREVAFTLNLKTGQHHGGGFTLPLEKKS